MKNNKGLGPLVGEGDKRYVRLRKRLFRAKQEVGSYGALARALGVNVGYLHPFVVHGREPRNPDVRRALGLPSHIRRPGTHPPARNVWYWEHVLRFH